MSVTHNHIIQRNVCNSVRAMEYAARDAVYATFVNVSRTVLHISF